MRGAPLPHSPSAVRPGNGLPASPGMKVSIGHGMDGSPVHVQTTTDRVVVLLSDPGQGKTTLARYLTRWWIADPRRTARIFATRPHEYTDLMTVRSVVVLPLVDVDRALVAPSSRELTVIDTVDTVPVPTARLVAHRQVRADDLTIVTSSGHVARELEPDGCRRLGLVTRPPGGRPLTAAPRRSDGWDGLQGRLDWPSDVEAVVPDIRGARDLPVHRWQVIDRAAG